jgi:hypothetical protein
MSVQEAKEHFAVLLSFFVNNIQNVALRTDIHLLSSSTHKEQT